MMALGAVAWMLSACSPNPRPADRPCEELEADLLPLLGATAEDVYGAQGVRGTWNSAQAWVEHHLVTHDEWTALGACSLRAGRVDQARRAFTIASRRVRHSADSAVGLGHVALRSGQPGEAVDQFCTALDRAPGSRDAREGLGLALQRLPVGDPAAATAQQSLQRVVARTPGSDGDLHLLAMAARRNGKPGEFRRGPDVTHAEFRYAARVGKDFLEVRDAQGDWNRLFVRGVNIGPALPGRFASEAPEDEPTWSSWLSEIADLGANAVRVYTLQPPAFYRALSRHNAGPPGRRLWLLQGVWADLPPDDEFDDPGYVQAFRDEIGRVVDAVHGDLVLDPERGHARGVFDADVSAQTLAWIVGREWEPFAVAGYVAKHPGRCGQAGRFVRVEDGNAMECWIARMLDHAAAYEATRHGTARPVTFANWPTLDPLFHPTEATRDEEDQWRHRLHGQPLPARTAPAWDDDAVSVDASVMRRGSEDAPGVFASYHVYPNFPYFMNLEPSYATAADEYGPLRYAGYLRALKAHHGEQPVLVAEFGMSSSRGIAHLQPEGLHHGGHDEVEAMRQSARLLNAIHRENMAGGIAFEFMDEWFKGTWSTSPFELPEEHRPRWFNAESPEQSYGLYAARPVAPVRVDGDGSDWADLPVLARAAPDDGSPIESIRATYDAGWMYLLLQMREPSTPDWPRTTLSIGLDTYAPERGERRLPAPADCATTTGVEFALVLQGPGHSELLVTPDYLQRHPSETGRAGLLASPLQPAGRFVAPALETNRERYARDGTRFTAQRVAPGRLRFGSLDPASAAFDTRSDVAVGDTGAIEIRLPWSLLNFADPSTGLVLHNLEAAGQFGTAATDGIRLHACSATRGSKPPVAAMPPAFLALDSWVFPRFRLEPKHGLQLLQQAFAALPATTPPPDEAPDPKP